MNNSTTATARPTIRPVIGNIEITKIVREYEPVYGDGTGTFGEVADDMLRRAALAGQEVQSFKVEIDPDAWQTFATSVRDSGDGGMRAEH